MYIGEIIIKYRKEHRLSLRAFAEKCNGITHGYLAALEKGENPNTKKPSNPSPEKLEAIARGMDITYAQLDDMMNDRPIKESYAPNARPEHGVLITAPREETFSQEFIDRLAEKLNVELDERINKSINERISQNPEIQPRKYKMLSAGALTLTDDQLDKVYAMAHLMYPDRFPLDDEERKEGQ